MCAPDPGLAEGFSTCFGELQPTDPSPGCSGRAWPTCEKGRGESENNPASAKGGRELGSDLLASLPAVCSRWESRRGKESLQILCGKARRGTVELTVQVKVGC